VRRVGWPYAAPVTGSRAAALLLVLATACGGGTPAAVPATTAPAATPTTSSPSPTPVATVTPSPTPRPTPKPTPPPSRTASPSPKPKRTPAPPTPTFEGVRRGVSQGPDYHAVLVGMNYGGDGGYNVWANCRPGTVRVTIHEDGVDSGRTSVSVSADDKTMLYSGYVHDGYVITGRVTTRVRVMTGWPGSKPFRIEYDCR